MSRRPRLGECRKVAACSSTTYKKAYADCSNWPRFAAARETGERQSSELLVDQVPLGLSFTDVREVPRLRTGAPPSERPTLPGSLRSGALSSHSLDRSTLSPSLAL